MAPAEVLCKSRHFSLLRPGLGESDHVEKVLTAEASAIFIRQLSRQRRDNLNYRIPPGHRREYRRRIRLPISQLSITSPALTVRATRSRVDSIRLRRSPANSPRTRVAGIGLCESCSGRWSVSLIVRPGFTIICRILRWRWSPAAHLRLCADQVETSRLSVASLIPYEQFIVVRNRILLAV
jgi:hypothetical protein